MPAALIPANEAERLAALGRYDILDSLPEALYDDLTLLASQICGTPISLISFVDRERQWFKSSTGIEVEETPREVSFCAHALNSNSVFEISDASADARFQDNALVTGEHHVRFYAGAPLVTGDGLCLGTLCVIDQKPHHLTDAQRAGLEALARQVMTQLELRRTNAQLEDTNRQRLEVCRQLQSSNGQLRHAREEFRRFMDNSPVIAFIKDRAGRYLYCNRVFEWTFNLKPRALMGGTDFDWLPSPIAHAVRENDALVMKDGHTLQILETVPTPGDGECQWLVYKFPIGEGEERRLGGVALDLTELRRAEKLKNEFVAVVSHELRTPLTAMRGSLGLLQNGVAGQLPPSARDMVALALKNAERLGLLIDDLLDIEKIESGAMRFEMAPLQLEELLRAAIEVNAPYAASMDAAIVAEPLPLNLRGASVEGDFNRLMQVLTNLMSNAAKYTRAGGKVWVSAHRIDPAPGQKFAGSLARIEVRDEGAGVPPEFASRLFERFAQADSSATRKLGGTGLGLAVSRAIMEKHGTRIGYQAPEIGEQENGGGATFFFELKVMEGR